MSKTCFIIAPIGAADSEVRKRSDQVSRYILRPALERCGYEAVRADQISTPGLIKDQVIARVVSAELAIADLTGHNPNVYCELGIRHALNRPVIQIADSSDRSPFDVAQIRTIMFDYCDLDSVFAAKDALVHTIQSLEEHGGDESPVERTANSLEDRQQQIPVSAYFGEFSEADLTKVSEALELIGKALGVTVAKDLPAEDGSWFKRWLMATKDFLNKREVSERLRKRFRKKFTDGFRRLVRA